MIVLQRLLGVPTVPERMQAEFHAWAVPAKRTLIAAAWYRPVSHARMLICLGGAGVILGGTRLLLRLGLIEPGLASGAFPIAVRLCRSRIGEWRRSRRRLLLSHR